MAVTSFLDDEEVAALGLAAVGRNVRISRYARLYGAERIFIGDEVRIDDFCLLSAREPLRLGRNVHIAAYAALFGSAGLDVGAFTGISSRVSVYTTSDDYTGDALTNPTVPDEFRTVDARPLSIGRHVLVGSGCVILPGGSLGDGVAVAALSLVTRPIPEWTVAAGIPARPLQPRSRGPLEKEAAYLATLDR